MLRDASCPPAPETYPARQLSHVRQAQSEHRRAEPHRIARSGRRQGQRTDNTIVYDWVALGDARALQELDRLCDARVDRAVENGLANCGRQLVAAHAVPIVLPVKFCGSRFGESLEVDLGVRA